MIATSETGAPRYRDCWDDAGECSYTSTEPTTSDDTYASEYFIYAVESIVCVETLENEIEQFDAEIIHKSKFKDLFKPDISFNLQSRYGRKIRNGEINRTFKRQL